MECGIIIDGIPEGAISRKVGLIWGIPAQTKPLQTDGVTMAVLGVAALAALRGYLWVQAGETWKAVLMGAGVALALAVGGWAWHRWKKARKRVFDPIFIKGEGLPHRLRRRDSGDGDPAPEHPAPPGE